MISLQHVSFSYQGQERGGLHDVNLNIASGECVLLCGRSGCGKTTITRLINGLIPSFFPGTLTGRVLLDGQNVLDLPMYTLAERVGSVFQNPRTQFFNVDTNSEIAFGIENEALPPEELAQRVAQTATDLSIAHLRGRNIFELSGGEKQKIAFASVYAMQPDVFLLDEPSSNLDMQSIAALGAHLRLIKAQGKTVVIAEHRLHYLMDIVDRIVYLEDGRIQGVYTPDALRALPAALRRAMGLRAVDLGDELPQAQLHPHPAPSLTLQNVSLHYQKQPVLERINLSVSAGEVIAIVGQNGAGKTTFSRALCGLHKDCTGAFLRDNTPQNHKQRLKSAYMVMQDVGYQLFAESVARECTFGIRHPDSARVRNTMQTLGLSEYSAQHPNTLSGGQKQRVAVAVSMVCGKEFLVFDEPTSGLDYDSMAQVAALIETLASQGKTIFVVTHDYEFVCRTCARVLHFDGGTLKRDFSISNHTRAKLQALFAVSDKKEGTLDEKTKEEPRGAAAALGGT